MDDIIVIGFYAPLHCLLSLLPLFVTGDETQALRRRRMRSTAIDSTWSLVLAFVLVIVLTRQQLILPAMLILLSPMALPLLRIWHARRMSGATE